MILALIIFKVLVKKIEHISVSYNLSVPSNVENDTTLDYNNKVYVKYDDCRFYPEFIVYYKPKDSTFKHFRRF